MNSEQIHELLYQALETEQGGQRVYKEAINCAQTSELREEWEKYLTETQQHEQVLLELFTKIALDPSKESPGRGVVRHKANGLVAAMQMARKADPVAGELCAAESVVEAETKDHQNWELIGRVGREAKGELGKALLDAHRQVEDQEDEHLYHTMGWARELWIRSLGLPAVIPPPEEQKKVSTAIGAARAEQAREEMLGSKSR